MGERMIEVECHHCDENGRAPKGVCLVCGGGKVVAAKVRPGTLTAARLRLADAAEALEEAERKVMNEFCFDEAGQVVVRRREYRDALAALRTKRGEG